MRQLSFLYSFLLAFALIFLNTRRSSPCTPVSLSWNHHCRASVPPAWRVIGDLAKLPGKHKTLQHSSRRTELPVCTQITTASRISSSLSRDVCRHLLYRCRDSSQPIKDESIMPSLLPAVPSQNHFASFPRMYDIIPLGYIPPRIVPVPHDFPPNLGHLPHF